MKKIVVGLTQWNIGLAVLYVVQGVLILIFGQSRALPVTTSFLSTDTLASKASGHSVLAPAIHHLFDINLAILVAAVLFIAAFAHLLLATWYRKRYEAELGRRLNRGRWIEGILSAGIMVVVIGLLVGVQDIAMLIVLFGLAAVASLLGLVMELHSRVAKRANWLSYGVGCLTGIVPWIVIGIYLLGGDLYGSHVAAFVYWVAVSTFVLFLLAAINMYVQHKKLGKWANYIYGERVFMILGLVAKSALAWQIFAGTLR
jgi:hypothetical protein